MKALVQTFTALAVLLLIVEGVLRAAGWYVLREQERLNADPKGAARIRIVTLGESTTADAGSLAATSWPRQLESRLIARGFSVKVTNLARPGANTTYLLKELEGKIGLIRPQIVISMMGINDADNPWLSGLTSESLWTEIRVLKLFRILTNVVRGRSESREIPGEAVAGLTRMNYQQLARMLKENGIAYIAMQYPTLSITELMNHFRDSSLASGHSEASDGILQEFRDVIFVENKAAFSAALKERARADVFTDEFGKTFGHTTEFGHGLIAKAAEDAVIKVLSARSLAGMIQKTRTLSAHCVHCCSSHWVFSDQPQRHL